MAPPHQTDHDIQFLLRAPTFEKAQPGKPAFHEDIIELDPKKEEKGFYDSDATTRSGSRRSHTPSGSSQTSSRRTSSVFYETDQEGLPIIQNGDIDPARLLRMYAIKASDVQIERFWTLKLLRHILTRDRIEAKIKSDMADEKLSLPGGKRQLSIGDLVDAIHPEREPHPYSKEDKGHYMRIYALLLLTEKSHEIVRFIQNEQSDGALPFQFKLRKTDGVSVVFKCQSNQPIEKTQDCFKNFTSENEKESINNNQKLLLTPYFDLDGDNQSRHTDFPRQTILPWCKRDEDGNEESDNEDEYQTPVVKKSAEPSGREGAFGLVRKVKLHPTSHGFRKVLEAIQLNDELFALKKLDSNVKREEGMQKAFEREVNNLRRFSGLHEYCDHLVTLLATFTLHNEYYFLFPWADYSLDEYWEDGLNYAASQANGGVDIETVRWVARQIAGITKAIDTIHEPRSEKQYKSSKKQYLDPNHVEDGKPRYGRHGDIKPDNILWFKSGKDRLGILVVSDMGLTSVNRDTSRSNIPGRQIEGGAGYRPPECEVLGGTVNRSFDIWTLGCLYLELITWLLGGWKLVDEFTKKRTTYYIITRTNKDLFFDLKQYRENDGSTGTVAVVKDKVKEWFVKLHAHENCTKFVHDVLDKVEKEMLIILSKDKSGKRSMSGPLKAAFQGYYEKCMTDESYATKKVPEKRKLAAPIAVEAELAPNMEKDLKLSRELGKTLETYSGPRQKSMRKEDLERMDEVREGLGNLKT